MSNNNEELQKNEEQDKPDKGNRVSFDTFSENVAQRADVDKTQAKKFVRSMFDYIGDGLQNEDSVSIFKFGTFKKVLKPEREAINPVNQEKIIVPEHYKVSFDASSALANEVNRKYRHLKPNVIDELLTLTGLTKVSPEYMALVEKDEQTHQRWQKAKKRALWILIILLILLLLFLATIIFVPVYCYHQNNKVVNFCKRVNEMFGLNGLSDRLRGEDYEENVVVVQPLFAGEVTGDIAVEQPIVSEDMTDSVVVAPVIIKEKAEELIQEAKDNIKMNRAKIDDYVVKSGDTIFGIAAKYWGNQYLWPDLYILNQKSVCDPDLIYPDEVIEIYEKIGDPENLTKSQRESIVQAYITVYRVYRAFGENDVKVGTQNNDEKLTAKGRKRIEDSCWTLYTAIRYDNNLLKTYKDAIIAEDIDKINLWITNLAKKAELEQKTQN